MKKLVMDKKHTQEIESSVELEGRIRVLLHLRENDLPFLPDNWDWRWISKEGRLTVRIAKHFKKEHELKVDPKIIEQLGTIAGKFKAETKTYEFDFTNKFNWSAGEFGDYGSCFWGSNRGARAVMMKHKFAAIRFYENGVGVGRAWIGVNRPEENTYTIFNAYGPVALRQVATIIAKHLGDVPIQAIDLCNNRDNSGLMYINGGRGVIIGATKEPYAQLDFKLNTNNVNVSELLEEDDEDLIRCSECGDLCREGEISFINDSAVCDSCVDNYYTSCYNCEEWALSNTTHAVYHFWFLRNGQRQRTETWWCEDCYNNADECAICHDTFRNDAIGRLDSGDYVCNGCAEEHVSSCELCGDSYITQNGYTVNALLTECADVCSDCYYSRTFNCRVCNEKLTDDHKHSSGEICNECYEDNETDEIE